LKLAWPAIEAFIFVLPNRKNTKSATQERCGLEATLGHSMPHRESPFLCAGDFHCRLRKYGRL
jgi:hypothetical protein